VIAHPTHILRTTRSGSRSPVPWLNQPRCQDKGEPKRRRARACTCLRIVEPDAKSAVTTRAVLDASPLLVILHYLLKNNTEFMMGYGAGHNTSRREQGERGSETPLLLHPREVGG
jgi:hypothetical protein